MKVVVTGGAGFIGSHLARRLLNEKHEVVVIDELHPYYSVERKKRQLEWVKESGSFHFIQKSLLHNAEELDEVFSDIKADCMIHLAALPGVSYSIEAPNEYIDYDITATVNALKLAGKAGINHFIFASSSSVYGERENIPLKEEMANGRVISPYAAAKTSAESFCHAFASLFGYQMTILRFFTVYGPWGRPDMAISSFIRKAINNEGIHIFGNGSARDYTYIDDCVDGIIKSMDYRKVNEIFNIGSGNPISLQQLVTEIQKYFPHLKMIHEDFRKGDVMNTWADYSKAKRLLQYEPKVSFEEGIRKTVHWALKYEV
ncbi:MAG TPA: NAD-dependent epimerase/dehydratase family protein [Pseudoneobacillus sp.]|nr:NAD-dependent epimerase/dehydratase family protein [Pseudoneobacillus sp.]